MAARVCPDDVQQLHHFVPASPWPVAPLEAVLVVDDTSLRKQGRHSVGVGSMYCGEIQAQANAQGVVTMTLARGGVPGAGRRLAAARGEESGEGGGGERAGGATGDPEHGTGPVEGGGSDGAPGEGR